jgi:hypothetical protein
MAMMTREDALRKLQPVVESFQKYHQHEVEGLKELPQKGGMLFVVNHSLATYDIILLMLAIYKETERLPRPLIDRLFFKIPLVKELVAKLGAVEGSPDVAKGLLDADEIVTVAPGGMFEALRSYKERYQIRWNKRYGFARLAMKAGKPVILAACPKADDMYQVYPSHLTSWIYQTYKIPFFIARGIGPTPIPRPVKLVHYLSEPIHPPKMPKGAKAQEAAIQKFHGHLVDRMETLMAHAVQQQQPVTSP